MKSTIAISKFRRIHVQPCKTGGITLEVCHGAAGGYQSIETMVLDADQVGAFLWAVEAAADASATEAANS